MGNSWFVTFSGVSACVVYHESLYVYCHRAAGQFVVVQDSFGKVWDVYSCVTFTCDVEFVLFELWELFIKLKDSLKIVLGGSLIRIGVISVALTESDLDKTIITPPGV